MKRTSVIPLEERTARITILIDPRKKAVFEQLCAGEDLTPSQVIRSMIRSYIEQRQGRPWSPADEGPASAGSRGAARRRGPKS
jgi:hypothetical protein